MNALDLLSGIEKTSSRKEKEELLKSADDWTKTLLQWALDPYRTYGLQNIPAPAPRDPELEAISAHIRTGLQVDEALFQVNITQLGMILEELQRRNLVGNEAREVVGQFLKELPYETARWFHRVIIKDLSCGVTEKTVNKVFPGLIPSFSVQLAEDASGTQPKVAYPVWCDYKLDGLRMVAIKEGNNVTLYSRKGHEIEVLPSLQAILATARDDFMLDGEVMGRSWNETQSTVFATKNTVDDSAMFYNVFDGMPLHEWKSQKGTLPYGSRQGFVKHIVQQVSHTRVRSVGGKIINSYEGLMEFYKQALQGGHEGIMVKDMSAVYAFKRSKAVMKMKPSSTWEGTIIGWEKGDPNGKWKDCFGAFQVQFAESGPVTSVGGGFTDEQRHEFTDQLQMNPKHYNGQIIEVKGQELTKDGVVRFPVFVRFRDPRDR